MLRINTYPNKYIIIIINSIVIYKWWHDYLTWWSYWKCQNGIHFTLNCTTECSRWIELQQSAVQDSKTLFIHLLFLLVNFKCQLYQNHLFFTVKLVDCAIFMRQFASVIHIVYGTRIAFLRNILSRLSLCNQWCDYGYFSALNVACDLEGLLFRRHSINLSSTQAIIPSLQVRV